MVVPNTGCVCVAREALGLREERRTMKFVILITLAQASGRGEAQASTAIHHGRATHTEPHPLKRMWNDTVDGTLR